jgi:uncharacterized protein involved in outer membrane biogenesis
MAVRRRTAFTLILIAAAVLVALITLARVLVNLDRYRPEVISYLHEKTGLPVEIGRLTLALSPSLSIRVDDLGLRNPPIFPAGYFLRAPRAYVPIDTGALLHRRIVIKSLTLENPIINLISDPDGLWNFENPTPSRASSSPSFSGVISRVDILDGRLLVSNLIDPSDAPGPILFEARNISSILHHVDLGAFMDPSSSSVAAQGDLKADSLRFAAIQATNVQSKLRLMAKQVFFADSSLEAYGERSTGNLIF